MALSLVVSVCGVHSALAHASGPSVGVTATVPDATHPSDDVGSVLQIEHLAGHLTGVLEALPSLGVGRAIVSARDPIPTDDVPASSTLTVPAEPPRA